MLPDPLPFAAYLVSAIVVTAVLVWLVDRFFPPKKERQDA